MFLHQRPVPKWQNKGQAIQTITRLALQLSIMEKDRQKRVAQAEPGPAIRPRRNQERVPTLAAS